MLGTLSTNRACAARRSLCSTRKAASFAPSARNSAAERMGLKLRREGKDEFLYHCDINRCRVVKTTLAGEVIWTHGYPREDANYAEQPIDFVPTNVAFAPNGDFYVGDGYGSNHMLRYSLAGKFLGEIAKPGHDDGELDNPHGQWVDPRGETPAAGQWPTAETAAFRPSPSTALI